MGMEHKAVFWYTVADFKTSAENEGVSTTDMDSCIYPTIIIVDAYWYSLSSLNQKCLVELLLSTLAKENWTLTTYNAHNPDDGWSSRDAYHFTRPVQTS